MEDHTDSLYALQPHPQWLVSDVDTSKPQTKPNPAPSKFFSNFPSKSVLVGILLTILTGSWELVPLLLVGIAVSYGLFSRTNVDTSKPQTKPNPAPSKFLSRFPSKYVLVGILLTILTGSRELVLLLFVGIAVSYGLFSRRNVDTSKPQTKPNPAPSKFLSSFPSKSVLVGILLTILTGSWELVVLLFVGIAVSYGLFSRRNVENEKENHSKFDTTRSVFDDEMENPSGSDESKIQTCNSHYYRGNSTVLVAETYSLLDEHNRTISRSAFSNTKSSHKPLQLPVRRMRSQVPNMDETASASESGGSSSGSLSRSGTLCRSGSGVKNLFNSSLGRTRSGEKMGVLDPSVLEEKLKEIVVLPSPIPWRSRSGRFELKDDVGGGGGGGTPSYTLPPPVGESEVDQVESCGRRQRRRGRRRRSTIPWSSRPKAGGREVKWIKHYGSSHSILLVGEGDFSFSTCLAKTFGSAQNMVATSLDSDVLVITHYSDASRNINELKSRGCKVMHNIDATKMVRNSSLSQCKFDRIVFNFPYSHAASNKLLTWSKKIVLQRLLVWSFFMNAKKLLAVNGEIHVTHKTNSFHCEWDLPECASLSGLRLIEQVHFNLSDYPGYNNKYGFKNGIVLDTPFNWKPSSTFKFGHA